MKGSSGRGRDPRVALVSYSTRPRGGVVHAVHLAEALHRSGYPAHLFALGDPDEGFFRRIHAPTTVAPAPPPAETLEERVFRSVDALAELLEREVPGRFDIVHAQDCVAARAVLELRERGIRPLLLRTVHHIDDFSTPALVECQRRSVLEPDAVAVVSEYWRRALRRDFGLEPFVVPNGVDERRFRHPAGIDPDALRQRVGVDGRFMFLTVGGIEPRKGSLHLVEALARTGAALQPPPVLAVVGGHSFQDYAAYRERVLGRAAELGLELGRDLILLGTVPDEELPSWYHAADAFVFPSVKEGWGLVVLEAMSAGVPVVASDIPVFREYLRPGRDALLVSPGDASGLATAMMALVRDSGLRARLGKAGREVAARFTWEASAARHAALYRELAGGPEPRGNPRPAAPRAAAGRPLGPPEP